MTAILRLVCFFCCIAFSQSLVASKRDPLSEVANYQLDKNSSRTTSIVKDGAISMSVVPEAPYKLKINYRLKLSIGGNRQGNLIMQLPDGFFSDDFVARLRQVKHLETPSLKIDHIGFADASTLDGHVYPNCDMVKIYDIVPSSETAALFRLLKVVSGNELAAEEDFKDVSLVGAIYPGVPVLGAVKFDLAGKYMGVSVRAGGDYVAP
jgi:hypothetical protein